MAKRRKLVETDTADALTHNPFAALAAPSSEPRLYEAEVIKPAAERTSLADVRGKIVVRREKKGRAGKTATRVSGLPAHLLEEMGPRLKKALGCGAVIEGDELVLLGSVVDRAADWLENEGARRVVRS